MIAWNSRIVGYLVITIVQICISIVARSLLPLLVLPLLLFALLEELK